MIEKKLTPESGSGKLEAEDQSERSFGSPADLADYPSDRPETSADQFRSPPGRPLPRPGQPASTSSQPKPPLVQSESPFVQSDAAPTHSASNIQQQPASKEQSLRHSIGQIHDDDVRSTGASLERNHHLTEIEVLPAVSKGALSKEIAAMEHLISQKTDVTSAADSGSHFTLKTPYGTSGQPLNLIHGFLDVANHKPGPNSSVIRSDPPPKSVTEINASISKPPDTFIGGQPAEASWHPVKAIPLREAVEKRARARQEVPSQERNKNQTDDFAPLGMTNAASSSGRDVVKKGDFLRSHVRVQSETPANTQSHTNADALTERPKVRQEVLMSLPISAERTEGVKISDAAAGSYAPRLTYFAKSIPAKHHAEISSLHPAVAKQVYARSKVSSPVPISDHPMHRILQLPTENIDQKEQSIGRSIEKYPTEIPVPATGPRVVAMPKSPQTIAQIWQTKMIAEQQNPSSKAYPFRSGRPTC